MTAILKEILVMKEEFSQKKLVIFLKKTKFPLKKFIQVNGADVKKQLLLLLKILRQRIF